MQKSGVRIVHRTLSRQKTEQKIVDIKDFSNVPIIRKADNSTQLPEYTSILSRNGETAVEEEVGMIIKNDLYPLQKDLEKLLCTNALRTRFFLGEYTQNEHRESHHDKKDHDQTSLKRKHPDEKAKFYNENICEEIPNIVELKNEEWDKFLAYIEPYCASINKDNAEYLDMLIQEFSNENDMKIPDQEEYYDNAWSKELFNDKQEIGKQSTEKSANIDFEKNGVRGVVKLKHCTGEKIDTSLHKKILQEFLEQGILTPEDINRNLSLPEIKTCQEELRTVNKYNLEVLIKLKVAVVNALSTQSRQN